MAVYNFSSRKPIARVAYTCANFVPIAVPFTCLNNVPSKQKVLFSRMNSCENLELRVSGYFSIQYFTVSNPSSCGILEYNASMSNDVKMACSGMVSGRLFYNMLYPLSS